MTGYMHVPFFGLDRQYQSIKEEILDITDKVYSTGIMIDGPYVAELENAIAVRTNREHAIAVNSCTQALQLSIRIAGGTSVMVPEFSFVATSNSVEYENKTPVYIAVDGNGILDIDALDLISEDASTLVYVNLYGNIINYEKLFLTTNFFAQRKITVIEDAAQSFGGFYKGIPSGKLGTISCLSFDPTKNLPNYGSGGMILTDDSEIARLAYLMRSNAKKSHLSSTNSKLSEVDAAQLCVKLNYFDTWQSRRTQIANYYNEQLRDTALGLPAISDDVTHSWHKYVVYVNEDTVARATLIMALDDVGIETKIHYGYYLRKTLKWNRLANTCLSLPINPSLTDVEVEHVAASVKKYI